MDDPTPTAALALPPPTALATLIDRASDYASAARATNTIRAYRADWESFTNWCNDHHLISLPAVPATVAAYLTAQTDAGKKPATLDRRLVAISQAHKLAGYDSPTTDTRVRKVMQGIKRVHGTAQVQKAPILIETVRAMVATLGNDPQSTRDRALLLVGFAGAFRRSELVSLDVSDVKFTSAGMVITLKRSKTDQEGVGSKKAIPLGTQIATCPVRALRAWLARAAMTAGPIFRPVDRNGHARAKRLTGDGVSRIVKRVAVATGLPAEDFAGHSLRAGFATSAAAAGVEERTIMKQTGHTSEKMVRKYIREGELFQDNAAGRVGL